MERRSLVRVAGLMLLCSVGCASFSKGTKPTDSETTLQTRETPDKAKPQVTPNILIEMAGVKLEAAQMNRSPGEKDALFQEARVFYQQALNVQPNFAPAMIGMGQLYTYLEDESAANAAFDQAVKAHPANADVWYERGMSQAHFKRYQPAIESIHQATRIDPQHRKYSKALGFTWVRAGNTEEGHRWLLKTMSDAEARYNIGQMLRFMNQEQAGRQQLTLALQIDPKHAKAREALESMNAGGTIQPISHFEQQHTPVRLPVPQMQQPPTSSAVPVPPMSRVPDHPTSRRESIEIPPPPNHQQSLLPSRVAQPHRQPIVSHDFDDSDIRILLDLPPLKTGSMSTTTASNQK
jgi:tetratricopeptide (TPR) repeat protein